jgi:hypothetical protein
MGYAGMIRKSFLLTILLGSGGAYAGDTAQGKLEDVPEPPRLPQQVESGEAMELEPQVTIIHREDATIEEYRVNGRLYKIKVTPVVGPPYYLVDTKGDGKFTTRINDIHENIPVPQWVLLSW